MSTEHLSPAVAGPLPDLTTDRLDLRRFAPGDLDELADVFAQSEVWRFPYGRGFTRDETAAFLDRAIEDWDRFGFGCWVARTLADGRIVGYVGISVPTFLPAILPAVEVGWRFAPSAWGRGYATEGATAALDQAFATLRLERVCSLPQRENPRSARVCERLGMQLLGEIPIPANDRRGEVVALHYDITSAAWPRP